MPSLVRAAVSADPVSAPCRESHESPRPFPRKHEFPRQPREATARDSHGPMPCFRRCWHSFGREASLGRRAGLEKCQAPTAGRAFQSRSRSCKTVSERASADFWHVPSLCSEPSHLPHLAQRGERFLTRKTTETAMECPRYLCRDAPRTSSIRCTRFRSASVAARLGRSQDQCPMTEDVSLSPETPASGDDVVLAVFVVT